MGKMGSIVIGHHLYLAKRENNYYTSFVRGSCFINVIYIYLACWFPTGFPCQMMFVSFRLIVIPRMSHVEQELLNRNYSAILAILQITSYALGV